MRSEGWLVSSVALLMLVGCGSKTGTDATAGAPAANGGTEVASTNSDAAPTASAPPSRQVEISPEVTQKVAQLSTPEAAVAAFLSAMRDGDEQMITALLSTHARQATSQHPELAIQPPGSPNAAYRVGIVEYVGEDKSGAHVVSIWSERDEAGEGVEYEVVWVLRRENIGWRIAGMATLIEEDQPPLFLNFEDPEEMLALLSAAHQRREDPPAAVQAQAPAGTPVQR